MFTFLNLTIWRLFFICVAISWSSFTEQEARFCPINFLWKPHFQNQHNSFRNHLKIHAVNKQCRKQATEIQTGYALQAFQSFPPLLPFPSLVPVNPKWLYQVQVSQKSNEMWPTHFSTWVWHNTKGL